MSAEEVENDLLAMLKDQVGILKAGTYINKEASLIAMRIKFAVDNGKVSWDELGISESFINDSLILLEEKVIEEILVISGIYKKGLIFLEIVV